MMRKMKLKLEMIMLVLLIILDRFLIMIAKLTMLMIVSKISKFTLNVVIMTSASQNSRLVLVLL